MTIKQAFFYLSMLKERVLFLYSGGSHLLLLGYKDDLLLCFTLFMSEFIYINNSINI